MSQVDTAPAFTASKLHPPRLTTQHVPRPRLVDQLRRHSDRPLTLVCAPAGSGKSTLLSEWLAAADIPSAWVSLDEHDNELVTFASYLLAAVQTIVPTATLGTRNLLRAPIPPPLETLVSSLSNDLNQIDTNFCLVLDDYHLITNPRTDELLFQLLRHPPRNMHLVIATRAEPSWPMAAFRARGQMTELRYSDLQFTADESAAFVRKALGDALAEDSADVLHAESEGWAAGLQLMTLVARYEGGQPSITRELGTSEDIGAYLFAEVLARQPVHIQNQLLEMSILERFCGPLCEAICARDACSVQLEPWGKDFLSHLEQQNLFVIALDSRHKFYRFHHLFQRFLVERLREGREPEEIAGLHRRASDWFAARGLIEEALNHALAAGDATAAADLVARYRHDLYNHEQFARLTRLLRLLPIEVKEHNPELLLAEARIATLNWRLTEAAVFLDRAEAELANTSLDQVRAEIAAGELAVLRGTLDYWAGNAERMLTSRMQHGLELLPLESSHLRGLAHMGIAFASWQLGAPGKAWEYLNDQLAETSPQLPMYATLLQARGFVHWLDGDLTSLAISARRLLAVSEDLVLPDQRALAHYFLGIAHFARNELELAKQELSAAVAARFNMRLLWWCQAAGALALTDQALGHHEQARQTLAQALDFILERHAMRVLPDLGAFQAELDRLQGRLAVASAWARQVELGPLTWTLAVVDPRLAQARVFFSEEWPPGSENATALVAELRSFCERVPNHRLLMEVEALAALLDDRRGEREAALETVQRLVLEAEPEGWVRLFVDLGEPMEALLRQLAARRVAPQAVARVLGAFPARRGMAALNQPTGLVEPLSERELEILAMLGERESNKEIAAHLFIAPSTVKRHTLNIYRKLEVNDRRDAVVRAVQLGLLSTG